MAFRLFLFLAIFGILNLKLGQGQGPAENDRKPIELPATSYHLTDYGKTVGLKIVNAVITNHRALSINQFSFDEKIKKDEKHYWYAINELKFDTTSGKYSTKEIPSLRLSIGHKCDPIESYENSTHEFELPGKKGWDAYKYAMLGTDLKDGKPEGFVAGYVDLGTERFGPCYLLAHDAPTCPDAAMNCIGTCPDTADTICETALDEERKRQGADPQNRREGSKTGRGKGLSPQSPLVALLFFLTAGIWICYAGIQSWISKDSFSIC